MTKEEKNRLEHLLNSRDISDEERKERDSLIAKQLREANNDMP